MWRNLCGVCWACMVLLIGVFAPSVGVARMVSMEPIVCSDDLDEQRQSAPAAYLVQLTNVEFKGNVNGILYSSGQLEVLKVYWTNDVPLGELVEPRLREVTLARLCDSMVGDCWAKQMDFESGQRWMLFDTSSVGGAEQKMNITLRDCPEGAFKVDDQAVLEAFELKNHPIWVREGNEQ